MKIFTTWIFKWWEVSFLKIGLLSLGIIMGLYFRGILAGWLWLWWTLFTLTTLYFLVKLAKRK